MGQKATSLKLPHLGRAYHPLPIPLPPRISYWLRKRGDRGLQNLLPHAHLSVTEYPDNHGQDPRHEYQFLVDSGPGPVSPDALILPVGCGDPGKPTAPAESINHPQLDQRVPAQPDLPTYILF